MSVPNFSPLACLEVTEKLVCGLGPYLHICKLVHIECTCDRPIPFLQELRLLAVLFPAVKWIYSCISMLQVATGLSLLILFKLSCLSLYLIEWIAAGLSLLILLLAVSGCMLAYTCCPLDILHLEIENIFLVTWNQHPAGFTFKLWCDCYFLCGFIFSM